MEKDLKKNLQPCHPDLWRIFTALHSLASMTALLPLPHSPVDREDHGSVHGPFFL